MSVFTNPASTSKEQGKAYTAAVLALVGDRSPVDILAATEARLRESIRGLSKAQLAKPEAPGKWSINHVLRHLADSEIVWGWRLRMVLSHDRPTITGYDQDAWADRLRYGEADAGESIAEFAALRAGNLRLLRQASPEDMQRVGVHAERGEESVAHMMKLYAGHDLLHLNQIQRISG
ncbi:MAG TPA: DinB family protein [Gemmatimonadaceae bacterium]|nr:DinB family protein [Gemmatimonadaceae bacterium]